MTDNIVEAVTSRYVDVYFCGRRTCRTPSITQRDYGRIYRFRDLNLPDTFEIHFANSQTGQSKRFIGENNEVEIPDEYLVNGQNVYAFIFLHETANDGETRYTIISPVTAKGPVEDSQPTPVQQDVITQAIAALNSGVETVQEIAEGIPEQIDTALTEAKESGEFDGDDGYSPTVTVQDITGGHRVTITDAEGDHVFDVMDGQSGGGGTSDYSDLTNKPQINGETLTGNKTASDLGLAEADEITDLETADAEQKKAWCAATRISQYWDSSLEDYAEDWTITANGLTITRKDGVIDLDGTLSIDSGKFLFVKLWPGALDSGVAEDGSAEAETLLAGWQYNKLQQYYDDRNTDTAVAHLVCPLLGGSTTVSRGTWLASAVPPDYEIAGEDWVAIGKTSEFDHDFMTTGREIFLMLRAGQYSHYRFLPTIAGKAPYTAEEIGAGTYSKPSGGIPASDLASGVIPDVSGFYTKPSGGIPASDLAAGIVTVTETVSGTTPSITAQANHRYLCGEVASISITPPSSGICDVVFTSGTTPTVLTVPSSVKWPLWFDPTSLTPSVTYEINIADGVYGAVMTWT